MKYSEDVMEIHNEFMTADEKLLKTAEQILSKEVKINPAKIARLEAFGFKSSKDKTAIEDDKKEKSHQQKLVEAINYFRMKFPNHKFIPSATVKSICEKYHLVSGEAHQYKGFVPDKNLTDIERFFETYPDLKNRYYRKPKTGDGIIAFVSGDIEISKDEYDELVIKNTRKEEVIEIQNTTKKAVQSFKRGLDMEINPVTDYWLKPREYTMGYDPYGIDSFYGAMFLKPRQTGRNAFYEDLYKMAGYYGVGTTTENTADRFYTKETTLRICAPISEMNTSGYEVKDGYKLVYDPIVSIEVLHKNGIKGEIILTAWGDEASDELVIDQNKN